MQWRKFTRLKTATGNSRTRRMLCCGRRKENGRSVPDLTASPGRAPPAPMPTNQNAALNQRQINVKEPVLLQGDFRKVSGISSEIFRQIEAVENDHDSSTAAALEAVERRGEMIVRVLEARCIGGRQAVESAQKLLAKGDARHSVQLVEIVKRPGQTLGLYIREGNGADRSDGVFISRIALESAVYNSGCLRVGDEILAVNLVDVTHMSLDDVVIIMSIPRRLVLAIRQRRGGRGGSPGPTLSRNEQKPPPVVVIKRDLRDEDTDELDRSTRSRSSRERRTGDGREMTESRSRLGLGLNNYSPQSEQLDLYYGSRQNMINEPNWSYKPPPPPSVITEQPKSHSFAPSHAYYQNAGTLESLAEKVHSFYPGPGPGPGPTTTNRRMSAGAGMGGSQSHMRFPRSGSDQHLPRDSSGYYGADLRASDFSSLNRHSLLRSSLKASGVNTLGRYGRYESQPSRSKFGPSPTQVALSRRARPTLDYSSDTEATLPPPRSSYYYRPTMNSIPRGGTALGGGTDLAKFNSLPRERPGARLGLRSRLTDRLGDESDGNISAPELPGNIRDLRNRLVAPSPSIFTSDEYRAWMRRAPSSSAIYEQMRTSRDILNQQRAHRFSCSAENIHDALKNTESIYSSRTGGLTNTLDRHIGGPRPITAAPIRSLSTQHIGSGLPLRSPSIRRMRQLLELSGAPASPGSVISGHQSPAPTPTRSQRQIDINPAEFSKYKLEKPVLDIGGISGMVWIHLLAGRGLRMTPEGTQITPQTAIRDLYCVLECDRVHKARTVVRSGDLQFDWDESFELDLVSNKQLDVLVYSWDPQHRHKLCYRGAVSLSLLRQSPMHQLALKVEPRGTIYLRLRYTDPHTLYRRRGLPNLRAGYPQLFGADLEAVVAREAKTNPGQAPVPIVLRRCVEEIERRGLDIIGLYRLCGSATKKRLLREAFERNCRAVELTPDHVPDINVITGVLKDYLRELPEPLFTRCLFQMTVDALGVCLPDDPEGNAKLMLSILDCLPRANRATLVFLLDHLSLVVSASERNKMSAQALATVMGPPLMLHSANSPSGTDVDHAQPIAVLKYLLQIWPQPQTATTISGHRNEPQEQRGNRVNVLQADKLRHNQHITDTTALAGQHLPSATHSTRPYQSAVAQSAPSLRASPRINLHQSADSADLMGLDRSPQPPLATPSPESSSTSTNSGSGSAKSADTVKRGASPITLTSSLSNSKLKESNSSYSIKASNNLSNDSKESYTLDRGRSSNSAVKNVLFAPGVEKSSSAYSMLSEQLLLSSSSSTNFNHHTTNNSIIPTTSTSQLIKQTLSPLVHHRPLPPTTSNSILNSNSKSDSMSPLKMKPNSISSSSFGSYHQISNALSMYNNGGTGNGNSISSSSSNTNGGNKNNFSLSTSMHENVTPSQRTSSPSRSLSSNTNSNTNTNTLPSQHVGRYQFESNYSLKNAKSKNYTSPGNATSFYNALNSISSTASSSSPPSSSSMAMTMINQTSTTGGVTLLSSSSSSPPLSSSNISNSSHIYGTLPKSSVSAVASEFEQLIARNASSNNHSSAIGGGGGGSIGMSASNIVSNNHGNYNTLGSYRVQYSSTNPFLNHFGETSTSDDK